MFDLCNEVRECISNNKGHYKGLLSILTDHDCSKGWDNSSYYQKSDDDKNRKPEISRRNNNRTLL